MDEKKLLKKINRLQFFNFCLLILVLFGFTYFYKTSKSNKLSELTVEKLTLIDQNGTERVQLTSDLSSAPFAGERLTRNMLPGTAGIIFMGPNGDEVGGIGFSGDEKTSFSVNAMDYSSIPLEAIGFKKLQSEDFNIAGLTIVDNPRKNSGFDIPKFLE